jgi:hypothetical protein
MVITSEKAREIGKLGAEASKDTLHKWRAYNIKKYNDNPKRCLTCGEPILYDKRLNDYCNHTCAALKKNKYKGIRNCLYCGKILKKYQIKFCSHEHQYNYKIREQLKETGKCDPKSLRRYLISTRSRKCSECGLTEWRGKPVPLEVHHIDGDSDNNKEENIILMCRNCHGISINFGNKNKSGNGRRIKAKLKKEKKSHHEDILVNHCR